MLSDGVWQACAEPRRQESLPLQGKGLFLDGQHAVLPGMDRLGGTATCVAMPHERLDLAVDDDAHGVKTRIDSRNTRNRAAE